MSTPLFKEETPQIRILDALVSAALIVAVAISGWALKSTIDLRERVAVIESNRFTEQDAYTMAGQLRAETLLAVTDIKRCLNQIQRGEQCDL